MRADRSYLTAGELHTTLTNGGAKVRTNNIDNSTASSNNNSNSIHGSIHPNTYHNPQSADSSGIVYRPIRPEDYDAIKALHKEMYPIDYKEGYYQQVSFGSEQIRYSPYFFLPFFLLNFILSSVDVKVYRY